MVERNLTSLGTNINSLATQLMVMMATVERTGSEAPGSAMQAGELSGRQRDG